MERDFSKVRKLVVKIGTSSLAFPNRRLNLQVIENLAAVMSKVSSRGIRQILVSSGAVGTGAGRLGVTGKPASLEDRQALASVGQAELIRIYKKFFGERGRHVAQVLLTRDGLEPLVRQVNAKNTLNTLLEMDVIPIINENDSVSTKEMEFGDNDTLSAWVAGLVEADLLVILSDIDGLYSADPRVDPEAHLVHSVSDLPPLQDGENEKAGSELGTGGIYTKLLAARSCFDSGIDMVLANGRDASVLLDILDGKMIGTCFSGRRLIQSK